VRVELMIPRYIDAFYPRVGIATLELLERLNLDVVYPSEEEFIVNAVGFLAHDI
jgi:L-lactate dehydrogenase complex protein LldE